MENTKVILTFESVDEILWCDHSNETIFSSTFTSVVLFIFKYFTNEIWDSSWISILGTLGSESVKWRLHVAWLLRLVSASPQQGIWQLKKKYQHIL